MIKNFFTVRKVVVLRTFLRKVLWETQNGSSLVSLWKTPFGTLVFKSVFDLKFLIFNHTHKTWNIWLFGHFMVFMMCFFFHSFTDVANLNFELTLFKNKYILCSTERDRERERETLHRLRHNFIFGWTIPLSFLALKFSATLYRGSYCLPDRNAHRTKSKISYVCEIMMCACLVHESVFVYVCACVCVLERE